MTPTSKLLTAYTLALVTPDGPDPHDVVTHFTWDPSDRTQAVFAVTNNTVQARNEFDEIVTSYALDVTFESLPGGLSFTPLGWVDGEMVVQIECDDAFVGALMCRDPIDPAGVNGFILVTVEV